MSYIRCFIYLRVFSSYVCGSHATKFARMYVRQEREVEYPMIEEKRMSGGGGTKTTPHECGHFGPRAATLVTSHVFMHVNSFPISHVTSTSSCSLNLLQFYTDTLCIVKIHIHEHTRICYKKKLILLE